MAVHWPNKEFFTCARYLIVALFINKRYLTNEKGTVANTKIRGDEKERQSSTCLNNMMPCQEKDLDTLSAGLIIATIFTPQEARGGEMRKNVRRLVFFLYVNDTFTILFL